MSESKVLAMYDFSAKQNYIYRTSKIKEIVGASQIIKESFVEFLRLIAKDTELRLNPDEATLVNNCADTTALCLKLVSTSFSLKNIGAAYGCSVVYEGGGNLLIVFDSEDHCRKANKMFSCMVFEKSYGLNPICAYVNVTDDFQADVKEVYKVSNRVKAHTPQMHPVNVLPYSLIDRTVSLPIAEKQKIPRKYMKNGELKKYCEPIELTLESALKQDAYVRALRTELWDRSQNDLGKLVNPGSEENGNAETELSDPLDKLDSLLACIYIDGNAMGVHNKTLFKNATEQEKQSYDFVAKQLRANSANMEDVFQTKPVDAVKKLLDDLKAKHVAQTEEQDKEKDAYWFRMVIGGGDEITLICNAHCALKVVNAYFESVKAHTPSPINGTIFSSCAGIAIFHSHDPFSSVYEIAEECCESGKKRNRSEGHDQNFYVDFHYIRSGITGDLKKIRADEFQYSNRPYCWRSAAGTDAEHDYKCFEDAGAALCEMGEDARGDIKRIIETIFQGDSYYRMETERLKTKYKLRGKNNIMDIFLSEETKQKALFDACLHYDLWFTPEWYKVDKTPQDSGDDKEVGES